MNVFLTVDTEIWWSRPDLSAIREDFEFWFLGKTSEGDFGVPYQIQVLNEYGLRAVFLVEPLFASAVGHAMLAEMVECIQSGGQDVQLHIHTEWLPRMANPTIQSKTGENIRDFSLDEQALLLEAALANLRAAGATNVCAFRAGNYGADFNTLRGLARFGIRYDTSHNACYLNSACGLDTHSELLQPTVLENVLEFPISCFEDWPGHRRHCQITACSFAEMKHALLQAHQHGWQSFVIVSHSFELLDRARRRPDFVVLRRFEQLCRFLDANRAMFQTRAFDADYSPVETAAAPLRGKLRHTLRRLTEQAYRRIARA